MDDADLLRAYAESGSQTAFAELVERRIALVFTAALRRLNGDVHLAEDVTQLVFTDLARKANQLVHHPALLAWLHQSTRWAAASVRRSAKRRQQYEAAAGIEQMIAAAPDPQLNWEQLRTVLDAALDDLSDPDRLAVLQRFFLGHTFAQIGAELGMTENTARMRVERALDKLRRPLAKRGITSTSGALALALGQNLMAGAVPEGLAAVTSSSALKAATGTAASSLSSLFLMSKFSTAAMAALAVALAIGFAWQNRKNSELEAQLQKITSANEAANAHVASLHSSIEKQQQSLARQKAAGQPTAPRHLPLTPEQQERLRLDVIIRKGELDGNYAALFRQLHLPSATLDKFKTLLVERNQTIYDALRYAKEQNVTPASTVETREITQAATADIDRELLTLLGPGHFQQFITFEELSPFRREVRGLGATSLVDIDSPSADARTFQLAQLLRETCPTYPDDLQRSNGWPIDLPAVFVARAEKLLPPESVETLRQYNEERAALRRMMEISRAAALQGKLELSKSSARDYPSATPTK